MIRAGTAPSTKILIMLLASLTASLLLACAPRQESMIPPYTNPISKHCR
ncbi:MAG: hypothetical protein HY529_03660 [Chloroflexi bacterium]|nr:hypothetical protein [Chloroflexota bacterium]